jgi:hypothetical protein
VADSCEYGNESSGSVKFRGFFGKVKEPLACYEDLCSFSLVS